MKAKDLMTAGKLAVCTPRTTVAAVAKMMKENNKGALPVVDNEKKVIGIVTDRDIALSIGQQPRKPAAEITVDEVLPKAKVRAVSAEAEITDVLREMRKYKIGRLPVTDHEGRLQGMISVNNILTRAVTKNEPLGQLRSKNENVAKTVKALFDRNRNGKAERKEK